MSRYLFLIPLAPLLGFLFNFVVGVRVLGSGGHGTGHGSPADDAHGGRGAAHEPSPLIGLVACGTVLLSFLVSVLAIISAHFAPEHTIVQTLWTWIPGGTAPTPKGLLPFNVDWAYMVDPLTSVMLVVVTFVGFLIHVYSIGYMGHDPGYARYMSYLNLFMFAMLTLVMGSNYLVLFVGWEGVGLCSYLLIGFWFDRQSAADAGKKAFIVNRIGDAGFLLGMFLIFVAFGSLDFGTVMRGASSMSVEHAWTGTLTLIGLLLFVGACGKSAQFPLYVWLPDAMEGPTPVSALIHAATMVTAGVYMVARSSAIYVRAPNALLVVGVVGAFTAIFAASIGLVQYDIKRVLAYSTVSQLGYMFLACGVGAFTAGIFHLATHAFFKALLFLGSGSVIHGMSGEQDMRHMGGLKDKMPWTRWTMAVGCAAIAGFPLLAGFFSKDEILWSAYRIGGHGRWLWTFGLTTAAMTAFYMFRLYYMTFHGEFRGTEEQAHHLHESPPSMVVPLQVLAIGSVFAGYAGVPAILWGTNWIESYLHPVFEAGHHAFEEVFRFAITDHDTELGLMLASVAVAVSGWFLARQIYKLHPKAAERMARSLAGAHRVLLNKYYVDELYGKLFVRGLALGGGTLLHGGDRFVVDGGDGEVRPGLGVNGIAWLCRDVAAAFSSAWDRIVVDGIVNAVAAILDNGSYVFRAIQNGLVQHYALAMLIGVFLLIGAGGFVLRLY
jgi:NADH-quinone oxidoreductase subunit L